MAIMKDQEKLSDQEEMTIETSLLLVRKDLVTDLSEKEEMSAMRIAASGVKMNVVQEKASAEIVTTTTVHSGIVVMQEALLATSAASTTKVVVTTDQNVRILNVAVAAVALKEERKTLSTTDQKLQALSVLTNISPTQASAHAAKPTTSSSLAQYQ